MTTIFKKKNKQKITSVSKDVEKKIPVRCWWEGKMVLPP